MANKDKTLLLLKLGERIRKLREEKNLSQAELANAIGKDQQSIQRLEAGKINPSFYYLSEVAKGLEIEFDKLLKEL